MSDQFLLDLIRGAHLLCLALGMGPALYFDLRTFQGIARPFFPVDAAELHSIHRVVTCACLGLWVTGLSLIYLQTAFDPAAFSPKLWAKLIVTTTLSLNALFLNAFVMPTLYHNVGQRLIDLPLRLLAPMTISAGVSLSCWLLALALGSSKILKTETWDVLSPVLAGGTFVCIAGTTLMMCAASKIVKRYYPAEPDY